MTAVRLAANEKKKSFHLPVYGHRVLLVIENSDRVHVEDLNAANGQYDDRMLLTIVVHMRLMAMSTYYRTQQKSHQIFRNRKESNK